MANRDRLIAEARAYIEKEVYAPSVKDYAGHYRTAPPTDEHCPNCNQGYPGALLVLIPDSDTAVIACATCRTLTVWQIGG